MLILTFYNTSKLFINRSKSFLVTFVFMQLCFYNSAYSQNNDVKNTFDKALHFYKEKKYAEALNLYQNTDETNPKNHAASLVIKGLVFTDSISFDEGLKYFKKADELLTDDSEPYLNCENYMGIGKGYFKTDNFDKSIQSFLKLDLLANSYKINTYGYTANYYLAKNFQRLKKIAVSNAYIQKAINIAAFLNDSAELFNCNYTYASNYILYLSADTSSFVYFDSIMIVSRIAEKYVDRNNADQMARLNNLYMKAFAAKDDFINRKKYALLSLNYYLKTADIVGIAGGLISASQAYLLLGYTDSALYYQQMITKLNINITTLPYNIKGVYYFNYYKIYTALKNNSNALQYLEEYVYNNLDIEYAEGIKNMQMREDFELQKTNQHIEDENTKTKALYEQKIKYYYRISFAVIFVLLLLSYIIYERLKVKKLKEQKNLQILLQKAELTALKAQMNPHFIFNALNSIQHSIVKNNTEEAYRFLTKFSKLIRNVLDNSSEQLISLKSEIETLSLYIEIESKRIDAMFYYELNMVTNQYDIEKLFMPSMIIQPIVENAIWHGLMAKEGTKILSLNFTVISETHFVCVIKDNGIGREKSKLIASSNKKTHLSKGISNIMERIKLLEITHSIKINIDFIDEHDESNLPTGTTVVINFYYSQQT